MLEVLRGRPTAEVATRWHVDADRLADWVRTFVEAGTAQVTDQPAAEAARQRDRFLAAFAHEVRTPLSMAQGWVAMLADGDVPADQARESLHRLHAALERLTERAFDVELMAELLLGRLALAPQLVSVSALAAELDDLDGIGGLGGAVDVVVDPALLRRVLRDLWQAAAASPRPRADAWRYAESGPGSSSGWCARVLPWRPRRSGHCSSRSTSTPTGPASRSASTWPGPWPPRTAAPSVPTRPTTVRCSGCGSRRA